MTEHREAAVSSRRAQGRRLLAVLGACVVLVLGFDTLTFAATGGSLILGRLNVANAPTIVQNTAGGAALDLKVASTAPPLTVNSTVRVPNLNVARAESADSASSVGGLSSSELQRRSVPGTSAYRAARQQWWGGRVRNAVCRGTCTPAFSSPTDTIFDGQYIWVANGAGNSVSTVSASTGAVVRTLSSASYGFKAPSALAFDGTNIWVANYSGDSVTVLRASDARVVFILVGSQYKFSHPSSLAFDGSHIWVGSETGGLTQVNASNGLLVRAFTYTPGFFQPSGLAFDGANIWVTYREMNVVGVLRASDGAEVRTLYQSIYGFDFPCDIAFDGTSIWVTNRNGGSVTQIDASNGAPVRLLTKDTFAPGLPIDLVGDGNHLWVVSDGLGNDSVVTVNAQTGEVERRINAQALGLNGPWAITYDGRQVWVANQKGNSLTYFPGA